MMDYIGYIAGAVIVVVGILIAEKVKVLNSTKNIFGILIWGIVGWFYMIMGNFNWFLLVFLGLVLMAIFDYFQNKKKEQAILNTVQYMITQENCTVISSSDIDQKLDYADIEMVSKTLKIYKSKALIPYNVNITE